jgi:hypothetical protein
VAKRPELRHYSGGLGAAPVVDLLGVMAGLSPRWRRYSSADKSRSQSLRLRQRCHHHYVCASRNACLLSSRTFLTVSQPLILTFEHLSGLALEFRGALYSRNGSRMLEWIDHALSSVRVPLACFAHGPPRLEAGYCRGRKPLEQRRSRRSSQSHEGS